MPYVLTGTPTDNVKSPCVAVTVTVVLLETVFVVAVNWTDLEPAKIFTEAGTVIVELLEFSVTTKPEGPAGPVRLTVNVAGDPPTTLAPLSEI